MIAVNISNARFDPGRVVATPGALAKITSVEVSVMLSRHLSGDWGNICDGDKKLNERALKDGSRVMSEYKAASGERIWIITDASMDEARPLKRDVTTFLLSTEY